MAYRENVKIKTKYSSVEECVQNCMDYHGESRIFSTYSRGIGGIMTDDGKFVLSSKTKGSGIFQFTGSVIEENGEIYLVGNISEKPLQMKIIFASLAFTTLFGLLITFAMAPLGILIGPIFMLVPWFNLLYIKRSDSLYHEIKKRVS